MPPSSTIAHTRRLASLARALLVRGGALQSTGDGIRIESDDLQKAVHERLAEAEGVTSVEVAAATAQVVSTAERALEKAASPGIALDDLEFAALEAIVQVTGRPAVGYTDGKVGMPSSTLGENDQWRTFVAIARHDIDRVSASVGRVALGDDGSKQLLGTAWRLGNDLVVTNRHVAEEFAEDRTRRPSEWRIGTNLTVTVDFNATDHASAPRRFAVASIAYCADEEWVDLAILRVDRRDQSLPEALALDWNKASLGVEVAPGDFRGCNVYVVGHPYREAGGHAVQKVFVRADGLKRWSPGRVTAVLPQEFEHDCSTLGGNSGSCVVSTSTNAVIGLHCAGINVDFVTAMARANSALALTQLCGLRAEVILRCGRV